MLHAGPAATLPPPPDRATEAMESAVDVLASGGLVVLDGTDHDRGVSDVVVAAQFATAGVVNALAWDARGLVCLALPSVTCDRLGLPLMQSRGRGRDGGVAFTLSIEARRGVTTGISAADRAATIAAAIRPGAGPLDLVSPGHVFPVRADPRGVRGHGGHAEAAIDLVVAADLRPAAVTCGILDEDGSVARGATVTAFARRHGLPVLSATDVAAGLRGAWGRGGPADAASG